MTWHNDFDRMTQDKSHGFTWGKFIETHRIKNIQIVEYYPYKNYNRDKNDFESSSLFHPFVCGVDLSMSVDSLEKALIIAIAHQTGYKPAAEHIFRMLEL